MKYGSLDPYYSEDDNFRLGVTWSYDRMWKSTTMITNGCEKRELKTSLYMNVKIFWRFFFLPGILTNDCLLNTPACLFCTK